MIRCYSELSTIDSFDSRFEYLKLGGNVGRATFGHDRYINQQFYISREWQDLRNFVIVRDEGCDLGVPGYEIHMNILIHHMNPITVDDIVNREAAALDPEFLITTTHRTHNDIHFGASSRGPRIVAARSPNDTKLW